MKRLATVVASVLLLSIEPAFAQTAGPLVIRYSLNSLSMVSIGDEVVLPIPAGAMTLRIYPSGVKEALAIRLEPGDVGKKSFTLGRETMSVELGAPAAGFVRRAANGGLEVEISTVWHLKTEGGIRELPLVFTTEEVESWSADGEKRLVVSGSRPRASNPVLQLVAKTTAGRDDGPVPGAAVYVVVSGTLDPIPSF